MCSAQVRRAAAWQQCQPERATCLRSLSGAAWGRLRTRVRARQGERGHSARSSWHVAGLLTAHMETTENAKQIRGECLPVAFDLRFPEWSRQAPSDIDGLAGGRVRGSEGVTRLTNRFLKRF